MRDSHQLDQGDVFFKHKYASIDIAEAITRIESYQEFNDFYTDDMIKGNILFREYLSHLIKEHGFFAEPVSDGAGYSFGYVSKVLHSEEGDVGRDFILAVCVFIGATVEETQLLLKYSGHQSLYARRKRDAIIWFSLIKGQKPVREPGEKKTDFYKRRKKHLKELNDFLIKQGYEDLNSKR